MKITILYDNAAWDSRFIADWGFSCLVEAHGKKILFDTGAKGDILLNNMKTLDINPLQMDAVFISHHHWDHTGGLGDILKKTQLPVYAPASWNGANVTGNVISIHQDLKIYENIYSTGELKNIEQSLIIQIGQNVVVVAGCAHPGVKEILRAASAFGHVAALIGGLHGFADFDLMDDLQWVCPTHCTRHIQEIATRYPDQYIPGGAGKVIEV
jgi:7,8-dihydropterin-6-yl-methyl-4-(beta-D-ribofuranosyl)aminobenzene 5'-phosphate synthase